MDTLIRMLIDGASRRCRRGDPDDEHDGSVVVQLHGRAIDSEVRDSRRLTGQSKEVEASKKQEEPTAGCYEDQDTIWPTHRRYCEVRSSSQWMTPCSARLSTSRMNRTAVSPSSRITSCS